MVGRSRGRGRGRGRGGPRGGPAASASRGRGRAQRFLNASRQVDVCQAEDLVEWITTPFSSSSSSLTQAQTESQSTTLCTTAASSSTVPPAVGLRSCPEESQELFQHSVGHFLLDDAQELLCTAEDSEEEQGGVTEASRDPAPASPAASSPQQLVDSPATDIGAHCEVGGSDVQSLGEGEEDEDGDWVQEGAEEDSEEEVENPAATAQTASRGRQKARSRKSKEKLSPVAVLSPPSSGTSAVWAFFRPMASDRTVVMCTVCRQPVKRGTNPNHLGTTCMIRHMKKQHSSRWAQHEKGTVSKRAHASASAAAAAAAAPTPPPSGLPLSSSLSSVQRSSSAASAARDADDHAEQGPSSPSSSLHSRWQITLPQLMERKRKYTASNPHAKQLNACLAKGLAVSLLPFSLVDEPWFKEFAHIAVPRWTVPSRHYFSRKAVPALHAHIRSKVEASLLHSLSSRVHLTTDTWSSKHGQGRYISITAHWVTLLAAGTEAGPGSVMRLVAPP